MTFAEWWQLHRTDLRRELDEHGLIVEEVALKAWNAAVDESATVAFDMPLANRGIHSYRWSETGKAMAWDISHAIRKGLTFFKSDSSAPARTSE